MYLYKTLFLTSAFLAVAGFAAADEVIYQVDTNTSSISGVTGYIDVQFEPSSTPDTATASLLHFSTGGTPVGAPVYDFGTDIGATSGSIAGGLVTQQNQYGSDYFQEFTFANTFDFDLVLDGSAGDDGTVFALSFYGSDGMTPLLTTNTPPNCPDGNTCDGSAGEIFFNPDGTMTLTSYPDPNGYADVGITSAPEPQSWLLLLSSGAGLILLSRLKKRAA